MTQFILQRRHRFIGANPYCQSPALVWSLQCDGPLDVSVLELVAVRLKAHYPEWLPFEPQWATLDDLAILLVSWAKNLLNSIRGFIQDAGTRLQDAQTVDLWLGFHVPELTEQALFLAMQAMQETLQAGFPGTQLSEKIKALQAACRVRHPDYQARILMQAALAADIPFFAFGQGTGLWQFGWGKRSRVFFESASNRDGLIATRIACSKAVTKRILRELGLPTPPHFLVSRPEQLAEAVERIGWPCVVKPLDRGGGKGVSAGIRQFADLQRAFQHARQQTGQEIMLERFVEGDDFRLLVIDGRFAAAIRRDPPRVVGDGRSTVRELLAELNQGRTADLLASRYLRPVAADAVVVAQLARQGLTLEAIPPANQTVSLRSNANLSTGGSCTDVSDIVHPELKSVAETLAVTLGFGVTGLDYMTTDIRQSFRQSGGMFIEINATPSLDVVMAAGGNAADLGGWVLGRQAGRITVILLVVAGQAVTWSAAIAELANAAKWAWSCDTQGGFVDLNLDLCDLAPEQRVMALLKHQRTEKLLAVWPQALLYESGVPFDKVDAVVCCEPACPPLWQPVIGRLAPEVLTAASPADALACCQMLMRRYEGD